MQPLLSIVVAVYNVQGYLEKCLQSLSNAAIDEETVEIVIVDDASADNCWGIIEKFCETCVNFHAIRHKTNLGAGPARNTGLESCTGQYVWFVDGDDYISPEYISGVLELISSIGPDILVVRARGIEVDGREYVHETSNLNFETGRLMPIEDYYLKNNRYGYTWMYISKVALINKNKIKFKDMRSMQDTDFYARLFAGCTNIYVSSIVCYNYVKRPSSTMNDGSAGAVIGRLRSQLQVYASLSEFIKINYTSPKMNRAIEDRLAQIEFSAMLRYLVTPMPAEQVVEIFNSLSATGIYPFRWQPERWSAKHLYYNIIKNAVNVSPIVARSLHVWFHSWASATRDRICKLLLG